MLGQYGENRSQTGTDAVHATFTCRGPDCFVETPLSASGSKEFVEGFHAEKKAKKRLDF